MEKARGWNRGGLRAGLNAAHVSCQNEAGGGGRWLLQTSAAPRRRADPWCWDALVCTHIPFCLGGWWGAAAGEAAPAGAAGRGM